MSHVLVPNFSNVFSKYQPTVYIYFSGNVIIISSYFLIQTNLTHLSLGNSPFSGLGDSLMSHFLWSCEISRLLSEPWEVLLVVRWNQSHLQESDFYICRVYSNVTMFHSHVRQESNDKFFFFQFALFSRSLSLLFFLSLLDWEVQELWSSPHCRNHRLWFCGKFILPARQHHNAHDYKDNRRYYYNFLLLL